MKKFKYKITQKLIKLIEPYILSYEALDLLDSCPSDEIIIGEGNLRISIEEGCEGEKSWIAVDCFTVYDSEYFESDEADYVEQAADFIIKLLTNEIERCIHFKGNRLWKEEYTLIKSDGTRELINYTKFLCLLPGKKTTSVSIYQYDIRTGLFEERSSSEDKRLVEVINYSKTQRIEIYAENNIYSFKIEKLTYDEYLLTHIWESYVGMPSGYYDTKERAIQEALAFLNNLSKE